MSKRSEGVGVGRGAKSVSRRKFLERTVATSGAALITATAGAQESKQKTGAKAKNAATKTPETSSFY
jgi:hypothetical protein